jgi:HEAT repeat protein
MSPPPPAEVPDARPNTVFQGQQQQGRPLDTGTTKGGPEADEPIEAAAGLRATPKQRPLGQPRPGDQARRERGAAQRDGGDPADVDDEELEDIPTLRNMALSDPDPERRLTAVTLLGVSESKEAIPILAQALSDQEEDVRMEAVLALADFVDEAPVQALEIALSDPSADVRYEALDVLSDIETPEAYQAMKRALNDPDEDVRELAEILVELYDDEDYAK